MKTKYSIKDIVDNILNYCDENDLENFDLKKFRDLIPREFWDYGYDDYNEFKYKIENELNERMLYEINKRNIEKQYMY